MRLRWTPSAANDLEAIHNYLSVTRPSLAQSTVTLLYRTVRSIPAFPHRGRVGERPGTRELVVAKLPFIIVYRTTEQTVEVLRILHGAQDRVSQ